jgi:hypothetical protein
MFDSGTQKINVFFLFIPKLEMGDQIYSLTFHVKGMDDKR